MAVSGIIIYYTIWILNVFSYLLRHGKICCENNGLLVTLYFLDKFVTTIFWCSILISTSAINHSGREIIFREWLPSKSSFWTSGEPSYKIPVSVQTILQHCDLLAIHTDSGMQAYHPLELSLLSNSS